MIRLPRRRTSSEEASCVEVRLQFARLLGRLEAAVDSLERRLSEEP